MPNWGLANKIIERMDLIGIMQDNLKMEKRNLPDYTVGELWCVGGISKVADMLMTHIEHKLEVEEKRKQKEEQDGK